MSNPTLGVWSLDDTLVGYTPAGSLALVGIDPTRFSNGAWFEESTINLFRNPRAAVDTAEIGVNSGAALTRVTDRSVVGPASFRIERIAGGTHGFYHNSKMTGFATSDPVTVSMQCESNDNLYVRIGLNTYTSGGSLVSLLNGSIVAVPASFDTVSATFTVPATATQVLPEFAFFSSGAGAASATGTVAYATVLQTEKKDHATSYTDGSLGDGYASVGTLWATAHTRAASSAALDPTGILDPATGAIAFRVTPTIETGLEELWGECGVKGSGTDHVQWGRDSSTHPYVEWSANNAAYQRLTGTETLAAGTECLFYTDWDGTAIRLSIDNGTIQTDTRDAVSDSWGAGDLVLKAE